MNFFFESFIYIVFVFYWEILAYRNKSFWQNTISQLHDLQGQAQQKFQQVIQLPLFPFHMCNCSHIDLMR